MGGLNPERGIFTWRSTFTRQKVSRVLGNKYREDVINSLSRKRNQTKRKNIQKVWDDPVFINSPLQKKYKLKRCRKSRHGIRVVSELDQIVNLNFRLFNRQVQVRLILYTTLTVILMFMCKLVTIIIIVVIVE